MVKRNEESARKEKQQLTPEQLKDVSGGTPRESEIGQPDLEVNRKPEDRFIPGNPTVGNESRDNAEPLITPQRYTKP